MIILIGYLLATCAGIAFGMLGAGGAILTVPVLVYIFSLTPIVATTYSLLVVGLSAGWATAINLKRGLIDWKIALQFAVPSGFAVFVVRNFIWPLIPNQIFTISKDELLMLLFAGVMTFSAKNMLKPQASLKIDRNSRNIILSALIAGALTGLLGVSGGLVIVPTLHLVIGLTMAQAVATSLSIIAFNASLGFVLDMSRGASIDWSFAAIYLACTFLGVYLGSRLGYLISQTKLRRSFAFFIIIVSVLILIREAKALLN